MKRPNLNVNLLAHRYQVQKNSQFGSLRTPAKYNAYASFILFHVDILWYHNSKFLKNTENIKIDINFETMKTTCTILTVTKENVGIYECKAINDVSESSNKTKLELASGVAMVAKAEEKVTKEAVAVQPKVKTKRTVRAASKEKGKVVAKKTDTREQCELLETKTSIEQMSSESVEVQQSTTSNSSVHVTTTQHHRMEADDVEIIEETEEIHVKIYKEAYSQDEIEQFKVIDEVNSILDAIDANKFGSGELPLRELATIGYLLKQGISIYEITQMYNADFFPALKMPESQSALVQLVERQGHENLITDALTAESAEEDDTLLASTVGFRAFMKMVEISESPVEELLASFKFTDFIAQEWKQKEIKQDEYIEITESHYSSIKSETKTYTGNA